MDLLESSCDYPRHCLICYSARGNLARSHIEGDEDTKTGWRNSSPVTNHLDVIFILRNVLEIPRKLLQSYLQQWGSPGEEWVWICEECDSGFVGEAKEIHEEMVRASERFKIVKISIIDKIKQSSRNQKRRRGRKRVVKEEISVTNDTRNFVYEREYRFLGGDLFQEGDKRACELAQGIQANGVISHEGLSLLLEPEDAPVVIKVEHEEEEYRQNENFMEMETPYPSEEDKVEHIPYYGRRSSRRRQMESDRSGGDMFALDGADDDYYLPENEPDESSDDGDENIPLAKRKRKGNGRSSKSRMKKCPKCPRTFHNKIEVEAHFKLHKSSLAHHCRISGCSRVFRTPHLLRKHQTKCHRHQITLRQIDGPAGKSTRCQVCSLSFPIEYFVMHVRLFHSKDKEEPTGVPTTATEGLKCHICLLPRRFHSDGALKNHLQRHKTSSVHCFLCLCLFNNTALLRDHILVCHPEVDNGSQPDTPSDKEIIQKYAVSTNINWGSHSVKCPLCNKVRLDMDIKEKLCAHLEICSANTDNDATIVSCSFCKNYTTNSTQDLIEHLRNSCGEGKATTASGIPLVCRIFECDLCPGVNRKYFRLDDFVKHYFNHQKNPFKCLQCSRRYPLIKHVHSHWRDKHFELMSVPTTNRFTKDTTLPHVNWWCSICNERFNDEDSRDFHMQNAHENNLLKPEPKEYLCKHCSKSYSSPEELRLHEGTTHLRPLFISNDGRGSHVCNLCGKSISCKWKLKRHILQVHDKLKPHVCDQCGKAFSVKDKLKRHQMQKHSSDSTSKVKAPNNRNSLTCATCQKTYCSRRGLKEHMMAVHQREYKFTCDLCPNLGGFMKRNYLIRHLARKHGLVEEKAPLVEGEDFVVASEMPNLQTMIRMPPKEEKSKQDFVCEKCGVVFNKKANLRMHIKRHEFNEEGKTDFKCAYCGRSFALNRDLKEHEERHTNAETKPYKCDICGVGFAIRKYLRNHKSKVHAKEKV